METRTVAVYDAVLDYDDDNEGRTSRPMYVGASSLCIV